MYKNYLATDKFDEIIFLRDLLEFGTNFSELTTIDLQRITLITEIKDETSEIMILLKEIACKNDDLKAMLKKLLKNIPKDEKLNNKMTINFPDESLAELEACLFNYQLITKTLRELFGLISNAKMFLNSGKIIFEAKLEISMLIILFLKTPWTDFLRRNSKTLRIRLVTKSI